METTGNEILYEWIEETGYVVYIDDSTFPANEFVVETIEGYTDEDNYCYDEDGNVLTLMWFYDVDNEVYVYASSNGKNAYTCTTDPYETLFDNGCAKVTIYMHIEDADELSDDAYVRFSLYDQKDSHLTYQFDVSVHEDEYEIYLPVSYYSVSTEQIGFETESYVCAPYVLANKGCLFIGDYSAYNSSTFYSMFLGEENAEEETESVSDASESKIEGVEDESESETETSEEEGSSEETDSEEVTDSESESVGLSGDEDYSYLVETEADVKENTSASGSESPMMGIICLIIAIVVWRRQRKKMYGR